MTVAIIGLVAAIYVRDTDTLPPVPGRSQPHLGPACETTGAQTRSGKRVVVNPETNAGPEIGPAENAKTRHEYVKRFRERRDGTPSYPPRPGQWS